MCSKTKPKWRCVFIDKTHLETCSLGVIVKVSLSSPFLEGRVRFELSRGRQGEAVQTHTLEDTYDNLTDQGLEHMAVAITGCIILDPKYTDTGEGWDFKVLNWEELYPHREEVRKLLVRAIAAIPLLPG